MYLIADNYLSIAEKNWKRYKARNSGYSGNSGIFRNGGYWHLEQHI